MIPESQVLEIICERCPGLTIPPAAKACSIYGSFEFLSDYAVELVRKRADEEFRLLTRTLHQLYQHCGVTVTNAIENIFVYKLGTFISMMQNREELLGLLPGAFKEKLVGQMTVSGI